MQLIYHDCLLQKIQCNQNGVSGYLFCKFGSKKRAIQFSSESIMTSTLKEVCLALNSCIWPSWQIHKLWLVTRYHSFPQQIFPNSVGQFTDHGRFSTCN